MKVGDLVRFIAFKKLHSVEDFIFYKDRPGLVTEVEKDDDKGPGGSPRYSASVLWSGKKHPLCEHPENVEVIKK